MTDDQLTFRMNFRFYKSRRNTIGSQQQHSFCLRFTSISPVLYVFHSRLKRSFDDVSKKGPNTKTAPSSSTKDIRKRQTASSRTTPNYQQQHQTTMKLTMIGALFAASSSAVSAFGPAFRASTTRSFSRTSELFANPKGWFQR